MNNYVTNDIFKAAALTLITGTPPSGYYTTDEIVGNRPVIYMSWDELPTDIVDKLKAGRLLVCPVKLSKVYRDLRRELIKQSKEKDNEKRTPIIKAG